jgi:hypothetical protein
MMKCFLKASAGCCIRNWNGDDSKHEGMMTHDSFRFLKYLLKLGICSRYQVPYESTL